MLNHRFKMLLLGYFLGFWYTDAYPKWRINKALPLAESGFKAGAPLLTGLVPKGGVCQGA